MFLVFHGTSEVIWSVEDGDEGVEAKACLFVLLITLLKRNMFPSNNQLFLLIILQAACWNFLRVVRTICRDISHGS